MRRFILLILLFVPTLSFAQYRPGYVEITPFGAYRWGGTIAAEQNDLFGQDVKIDDSGAYGLMVNIPVNPALQVELMVDHQSSAAVTDTGLFGGSNRLADFDVTYYHAGLLWEFDGANARPFFVLSGGATNLDPKVAGASSDNRFSGSIGGGVKLPISRNFGIRLEGRGFWTSTADHNNDCYLCDYRGNRDFMQGEARIGFIFAF